MNGKVLHEAGLDSVQGLNTRGTIVLQNNHNTSGIHTLLVRIICSRVTAMCLL